MKKIKISAVSYLNTKPFIYGIEKSGILDSMELSLDMPSVCAEKLLTDKVDIGLVPVAVIPQLKHYHIIGDYCIGAEGAVNSVMLYSQQPLEKIKTVLLDYQSKTSVTLVKVLAEKYWKINPEWIQAKEGFENAITGTTAGVVIGDRTFELNGKFSYCYDLSKEWKDFTGLPFVFACWVANKEIPVDFITSFNEALKYGIENRSIMIDEMLTSGNYKYDIRDYLMNKISYDLTLEKKKALDLFLTYIKE